MASRPSDPRVLAVLAALARGTLGSAYVSEVPGRMFEMIGRLASEADRRQLLATLRALDSRAGAAALTGAGVPVSWLSPAAAERLLLRWKTSRVVLHRRLAGVVTAVATTALYSYPGEAWRRIGYPGPLGPPPSNEPRLEPLTIEHDDVLDCDVVIVGSGAGGGCVAAQLAEAGLDVIVLEKGGYRSERDFNHIEGDASRDMYLYGLTLATTDLGCRILAGATLGGGTVVNYTTSFKTPDFVLREWAEVSGIDAFVNGEIEASLDAVGERLGVNTDSSAAGRRDAVMEDGLKALGWHVDGLPRAVRGCAQDEACGYCGFGCRLGAKQSTMRTYLEDAAAAGARVVVGADVRRVTIDERAANGVEALVGPHRLRVRARAVVAAGGSIETPALLLRSGLRGKVGHYLRLHPGTAAFGIFDDEVRVWEGTLQARYSAEFRHWDDGYGPIFETVPVHPGSGSAALPWLGAAQHQKLMAQFPNIGFVAVLSRDQSEGRVTIGRDGNPRVAYRLVPADERRVAEGVVAAGKVMEAAGAREVMSPHPIPRTYAPGSSGAHERWADETRRAGYARGKVTFFSFHQMGSCRMGVDPRTSVVGPENETHEVRNLFVADGSCFPTASGVNPMLSIYGIAHRAGNKIARRLS